MTFPPPETSRNIVGNGSLRPSKYLRLPIRIIICHWKDSDVVADHQWRMPNPLKSLTILARRDNAVVIIACGILYIIYTCINTSLSVLFIDIYPIGWLRVKFRGSALWRVSAPHHRKTTRLRGESHTVTNQCHASQ